MNLLSNAYDAVSELPEKWIEVKIEIRGHLVVTKVVDSGKGIPAATVKKMMQPFFEKDIFPPDVKHAIVSYLNNPAASSCSDLTLYRSLRKYDTPKESVTTVEKLPAKALFKLKDGRVFRKEEKLRKRYKCIEVSSKRVYLFSPVAEVELLEGQ